MIDLVARLDAETKKKIKQWPHPNNRASEVGHPCERFLVAARTHAHLQALPSLALQRIFEEGRIQERAMIRALEDAGVEILEQQRPFEWKQFQLSGAVDGIYKDDEGNKPPIDAKSCSPNVFMAVKKITTTEGFTKSKHTWIRKYPGQIMSYALMSDEPYGTLLFKNKSSGELHQVDLAIDFEYMEGILQKLERVNAHVAAGTIPDVVLIDDCKRCSFAGAFCFPGQDFGPGFDLSLLTDAEWIAKLEEWAETKDQSDYHDELDKEIKDHFKGKSAIIGDFKIESSGYESTSYKVPDEIKKQFAVVKQIFRTTIERL